LVAGGGDIVPEHQAAIASLDNTPMDDNCGEGIHRGTNLSNIRAPAITRHKIMAMVRHKQSLGKLRKWARRGGEAGRTIVHYEWCHFKRLIRCQQGKGRKRLKYRGVKCQDLEFYKRVYRLDQWAMQEILIFL
jgi:hypothetical protein